MICSVNLERSHAPLFRPLAALFFAIITTGCAPEEPALTCPLLEQPTKSGAFGVDFGKRGNEPAVVVTNREGIACYLLGEDGQIGERFCKVRYWDEDPSAPLPWAMMRRAVLIDESVAYYSSRFVVRADFKTDHATVTLLKFEVGGDKAQLTHLFERPEGLFGIWTRENINGTTTAGLAQVGADDVVRPIGAPFFNGIAAENLAGGGWGIGSMDAVFDVENDRFLIENLDDLTLVEIDRQGKLLASTTYGEAIEPNTSTHLRDWTKLPNGEWVGLNGGWLCHFDPRDRTTESCVRIEVASNVSLGNTDIMALNVDANGDLWAWIRVTSGFASSNSGVVLGRFDGTKRFEGPLVPMLLDTCDMLVGID